jgi:hypothetical protein
LCHNKRSDAVALNGGGNEEELRDDAYDSNTSTIRLMLSQQELEGNGEIRRTLLYSSKYLCDVKEFSR